jgi:predicted transcriptional regulator
MYTGMSGVISFRTDDEVVDTVDRIAEQSDEDVSRALVTKRLVEEAVEARETRLWFQLGMSNHDAAQLRDLQNTGETEEDVARRLLTDALEARDEDVLDAIGASDELREAVEEHREDGESLDGAVERLLRAGVDASDLDPLRVRIQLLAGVLGYTVAVAWATVVGGPVSIVAAAVLASVFVVAYTRFRPLGGLSAWG